MTTTSEAPVFMDTDSRLSEHFCGLFKAAEQRRAERNRRYWMLGGILLLNAFLWLFWWGFARGL